jgi:hypothetical protein
MSSGRLLNLTPLPIPPFLTISLLFCFAKKQWMEKISSMSDIGKGVFDYLYYLININYLISQEWKR